MTPGQNSSLDCCFLEEITCGSNRTGKIVALKVNLFKDYGINKQ
jgi:hypothetical protein